MVLYVIISHLTCYVIRKLAFYIFEFMSEEGIDSEAGFVCKRVIGEFSRKKHLYGSNRSGRS